jgi:3-mercaptopyruvate sulfurtransferase SseA
MECIKSNPIIHPQGKCNAARQGIIVKHLLDYPNVKNYDGSWTEWGNMIHNAVEKWDKITTTLG